MTRAYPFYLSGKAIVSDGRHRTLPVTDKYTGKAALSVTLGNTDDIVQAIAAACDAERLMRELPAHARKAALHRIAAQLQQRQEEFARVMVVEAGKPIRDARVEVSRAVDTFTIAAEECRRDVGENLQLDHVSRGQGYRAIIKRVPVGACSFITPFNFPLNLVAHKIAPAIAMGCPFVLKPAPQAPASALMLGEILAQCDLPAGAFSILPCDVADAAPLIEDDRIKLLSFTGSSAVGWGLKSRARKKKVVLELGGNAACIVDEHVSPALLDWAVKRITFGAFYQSGQSCISVQRLFVHETQYHEICKRLVEGAQHLKHGDPGDEETFLGPLISERDVDRIEAWVGEAVQRGGRILCGGRRIDARFYPATIIENVPNDAHLSCEEAFGPVMTIAPFAKFDNALALANESRYGLQAGVFTNEQPHVWRSWDELQVGGVIINDVPSFRIDSMPYGGVKDSGMGREGVRYAMNEMSELRTLVVKELVG